MIFVTLTGIILGLVNVAIGGILVTLDIDNIQKAYGKNRVLNGVSMQLQSGECVGVLGANGCGKSTLLGILAGIVRPNSGRAILDGADLLRDGRQRAERISYVPQGVPLFRELTAKENLRLWYDRDQLQQELDGGVLALLGIGDFLNVRVGAMSGGMKKRLSIGCAVYHHPDVLLLDEPSAALDLVCKQRVLDYLDAFRKQGGIILLATHDIPEIAFCDRLFIMKDGCLSDYSYTGNVPELVGAL